MADPSKKSEASSSQLLSQKPPATAAKNDPIWSILPSYYMYQSTFYGEQDPPEYVEASIASSEIESRSISQWGSESHTAITTISSNRDPVSSVNELTPSQQEPMHSSRSSQSSSLIVADELTNTWRETILDNIHQLRNMTDTDNSYSQSLEILVHFTEEVGEPGKVPKHVDPLNFEYKQGDYLNGYVLFRNNGSEPIQFDMCYIMFEGTFIVANAKDPNDLAPVKIRKFLEMYDFAASWNSALINRLMTPDTCPDACPLVDPLDGSRLCISMEKKIKPGQLYKRFFTFKIPVRLLDSECNSHNLAGHVELPPTLGLSRSEKNSWASSHKPVDDFSFFDTATTYGVLARFIGKAHKYNWGGNDQALKLINAEGEEFVILKEQVAHVRILQESNLATEGEKAANNEASRVLYQNLVNRVKESIEVGRELKRAIEKFDDKSTIDISTRLAAVEAVEARAQNDTVKARQLYTGYGSSSRDSKCPTTECKYNVVVPVIKKAVFGSPKPCGTLTLLTPKTEYLLNYISPQRFRYGEKVDNSSWKIQVPLEATFTPASILTKSGQLPEITRISAEFVVFTLKSNDRQIPVELNHDFLFKNDTSNPVDNFTHLVKRPLKQHATELFQLASELGTSNFKVERSLVQDLSAMVNLEEKYNNLVLHDVEVIDSSGQPCQTKNGVKIPWEERNGQPFTKKFSVCVDIAKALKKVPNPRPLKPGYKSYDEFTLVPSFHTCLLSRMYYLKIRIVLSNDRMVEVKVPVSIAKMPTN